MNKDFLYEVETRFAFSDEQETIKYLPFLKDSLDYEIYWTTRTYGMELFLNDRILRFSDVYAENRKKRYFIGHKEPDIGSFCNIRSEIDEEITDGLKNSIILNKIGIPNQPVTPVNIAEVFESKGFTSFMSFSGRSKIGKSKEYGLSLKLMYCNILQYPLLLEIEKTAKTMEEALECEKQIIDFVNIYKLKDRVVKQEPPTLLLNTIS